MQAYSGHLHLGLRDLLSSHLSSLLHRVGLLVILLVSLHHAILLHVNLPSNLLVSFLLHLRLVILLCLELMLNASNLALVAFSRMNGNEDGQVFAIVVMVIAACEVVVGLGIIVAAFRRRIPLNVDEMRTLKG